MKRKIFTFLLMLAIPALQAQQTFFNHLNTTATDAGTSQIFVQNDGYVLAGVGKVDNVYKLYLLKTSLSGEILWTTYHDLGFTGHSNCYASTQDPEGNMYLTLEECPDAHLIQITPTGEIGWMHLYSVDEIYQLTYHSSGELIAAGNSEGAICINRIDPANGNVIAFASGIAIGSEVAYPTTIAINDDNSITLSVSSSFDNFENPKESSLLNFPFSLETHSTNNLLYQEEYLVNRCTRVIDGEIYGVAHLAQYAFTDNRNWLTKFLPDGSVTMEVKHEFFLSTGRLYDFIVNSQDQIVALGDLSTSAVPCQLILFCMSKSGDSLWSAIFNVPNDVLFPHDIKLAADGGYIVSGLTGDLYYPVLIKTSPTGQLTPLGIEDPSNDNLTNVYPNPANDKLTISLPAGTEGTVIINDLSGRICLEAKIAGGNSVIDVSTLNEGMYLYRLSTGYCGKVIITRR